MIYCYNVIYYTYANPTDKTISFPFLLFRWRGLGRSRTKKLKRKWFWSDGRTRHEGDGAVEIILDFLQKKFGFCPKGTAINHFVRR